MSYGVRCALTPGRNTPMPNVALQAYSEPEREMNTLKDVCPPQGPLSVSGHFMMCLRDDDDARPSRACMLLGKG